jgi:hypothetical protein
MSDESDYDDSESSLSVEEDIIAGAVDTENKYNREVIVVHPDKRITSQRLTKFEMTQLTNLRGDQIALDNICMVDVTGLKDSISMAKRELMMRKCPIVLRREVGYTPDGKNKLVEDWDPNTMEFSDVYIDI